MKEVAFKALDGSDMRLDETAIHDLASRLNGKLMRPGDSQYEPARAVFNAMIQRRPGLIAQCESSGDVVECVKFARQSEMLVSVRGGGHNAGGLGVCEGGLVIDLSAMRQVAVDPEDGIVRAQGGCLWNDVDRATHPHGLAVPSGIISTTGVGGLTLGGGIGHLARKYALTIDNLLAAEVVLADGSVVYASATENPDLFWALRGGGGNFGVVCSFVFQGQPVSKVIAGPTLWPLESAGDVLRWYREFLPAAPEELNGFFAFLTVPPAPPFPERLWLQKMCGVVWCYAGPEESADEVFRPIREFGPPALHGVHEVPFPALQSAFDPIYPSGHQWYWRTDFVKDISDAAIEQHVRHALDMPTWQSTMHLYPIDGAVHGVPKDATAFSYRDATWAMVIVGVDPDPLSCDRLISWTRDYWDSVHPHCAGGAYVNFMMDEGDARVRATYRDNYPKLSEIKRKYDPGNLFRVNQNIRPSQSNSG